MVLDASRGSKSQENGLFHRSVWQGLMTLVGIKDKGDEGRGTRRVLGIETRPLPRFRIHSVKLYRYDILCSDIFIVLYILCLTINDVTYT